MSLREEIDELRELIEDLTSRIDDLDGGDCEPEPDSVTSEALEAVSLEIRKHVTESIRAASATGAEALKCVNSSVSDVYRRLDPISPMEIDKTRANILDAVGKLERTATAFTAVTGQRGRIASAVRIWTPNRPVGEPIMPGSRGWTMLMNDLADQIEKPNFGEPC